MSSERSSVLADTHVLIWYTTSPGMLSATALRILEDAVAAAQPIVIAAVSLIELIYIAEKRSDSIDAETLGELLASIQASDSPIAIAPMTVDVAHQVVSVSRTQVRDPMISQPTKYSRCGDGHGHAITSTCTLSCTATNPTDSSTWPRSRIADSPEPPSSML